MTPVEVASRAGSRRRSRTAGGATASRAHLDGGSRRAVPRAQLDAVAARRQRVEHDDAVRAVVRVLGDQVAQVPDVQRAGRLGRPRTSIAIGSPGGRSTVSGQQFDRSSLDRPGGQALHEVALETRKTTITGMTAMSEAAKTSPHWVRVLPLEQRDRRAAGSACRAC